VDVVLIGLPGSGKSAVGRRLAARHGATLVDLDEAIEREAGVRIPDIFAEEGEAGFRSRERAAIAGLGDPDPDPAIRRVIAPGGGAVVDPRNRWRLFRGRVPIWLDPRPEVLAQRLRNSPNVRPLVAGRDDSRPARADRGPQPVLRGGDADRGDGRGPRGRGRRGPGRRRGGHGRWDDAAAADDPRTDRHG
jgi:shikimate kinase